MIIRLGAKNFFSFKEGMDINFGFDGNVPEQVSLNRGVSTVMGIKGGNGSGKTNIIKAVGFLNHFCVYSYDTPVDGEIDFDPYFDSTDPTEFYVEFQPSGSTSTFLYELALTKTRVISERIYKTNKRRTRILERDLDEITFATKDLLELKSIQLRSNASLISLINKYKFKSPMKELTSVNMFFQMVITNVSYFGRRESTASIDDISKYYFQNPKAFEFAKKIIKSADEGIADIEVWKREDDEGKEIYFPVFTHKRAEKPHRLTYFDESSGTISLFKEMQKYWIVLTTGGLLAVDEFDIHLHALILPRIVDLFINTDSNPLNAQFIFTAHNTEIIDKLGKYRTILVNKEDNESYCYRLDEIPGSMVRNDRSIMPLYLEGKIGGVPRG